jgi:hypothetical protein
VRVVNVQGKDLSCVLNMYGGMQIHLKAFVTLALDRGGSSVLCPCVNSPQGTHWIGNWSRCFGDDNRYTKNINFETSAKHRNHTIYMGVSKGKAVPLQASSGPQGSRKLRFPDYMTTAQDDGKSVSLTHRLPLPPGNAPGTHFC